MASAIGKDINSTTVKLGKLAQCELCFWSLMWMDAHAVVVAKRKTLFDDRPVEISVRAPSLIVTFTHLCDRNSPLSSNKTLLASTSRSPHSSRM
jgi:hypothetical protein